MHKATVYEIWKTVHHCPDDKVAVVSCKNVYETNESACS